VEPRKRDPMPVDHYENFPVASFLLPATLRRPVEVIYAFARSADDFADEGNVPDATRLANLGRYESELDAIAAGNGATSGLFSDLAGVIRDHQLPIGLFRDLLDAFRQDVEKKRYADFAELMEYCRRSANPVGRLMLHLFRATSQGNLERSDAICSSLQLINHWQDIAIDWKKGRVYLPQEDLARFAVAETQIGESRTDGQWSALMAFQCQRARAMMQSGAPLGRALPGRIGLELRAIVAGGMRIADKIDAVRGDVFRRRPKLQALDWARIALDAVLK
jgi:phytoene synthase